MKVFIKGLNTCRMRNQKIRQYCNFIIANEHKIVNTPNDADIIIIWGCAFRTDVLDNSLSQIIKYEKEYKNKVVVTGCLPAIVPAMLKKVFSGLIIKWVDDEEGMEMLFGNKVNFNTIDPIFVEKNICDDVEKYKKEHPDEDITFHDQFIKLLVSEGCNYKCAYCSERLAFPPYKSFPEDRLVEACRKVVEETGKLEVILLADSLGEYGRDIGSSLPNLIKKLKTIHPELKIALNNLNPTDFIRYFEQMVKFIENGDIIHLNLPIQSASENILKLMDRGYTRKDIDKIFNFLNEVGFTKFDTHIIVGFPGETEEDFKETIHFILKHKFKYVLTSRYMESPGAPSASLPNKVDLDTMNSRIQEAIEYFKSAGIIYNADNSEMMCERFRRLNITKNMEGGGLSE